MGRSRSKVLFALVVGGALPAIVACNAILGIDDFQRTECGAKPCNEIDAGPDQIGPDNFIPDTGNERGPDAPPGADPVSWADFEMPNYKPDAGVLASDPRPLKYETSSGTLVTDMVTGLVWRKELVGGGAGKAFYYPEAKDECPKLPDGPWRLPKRIELVTLLSLGHPKPFIDRDAFVGFPSSVVWTSSEVRTARRGAIPGAVVPDRYWAVDFGTGAVTQLDGKGNADAANVLCVRDKQ